MLLVDLSCYHLFTLLPFSLPEDEHHYLLLLEYQLDNLDLIFAPYIRELEPANYVCIRDYDNNLIYGTPVQTTVKYFVEQRFPNTFYKWLFQLVPRNADAIEQAAFYIGGTDEETIFSIFGKMQNDLDVVKLFEAFGQRRMEFSLQSANLGGFLRSELNTAEMKQLNAMLSSKGIKTQF